MSQEREVAFRRSLYVVKDGEIVLRQLIILRESKALEIGSLLSDGREGANCFQNVRVMEWLKVIL